MSGNYTEEMSAVKKDLRTLKEDISHLTKSVAADAKSNVADIRATAEEKLIAAKDTAMEAGAKGTSKTRTTVRENPGISLLVAAGVSLIAGALLMRN